MSTTNNKQGVSVYQAAGPYSGVSVGSSNSVFGNVNVTKHLLTPAEYEFYIEAKNFISDMANSEDLPDGFRDQAKRMAARLVLARL